jgi:hypothetical protein
VIASSNPGSPSADKSKLGCSPVSRPLPKYPQVELAFGVGSEPDPNFDRLEVALELEVGSHPDPKVSRVELELALELGVGTHPDPKMSRVELELELELAVGSKSCDTEPFPPVPPIRASDWSEGWVEKDGREDAAGFSLDSFPKPGRRVALAGLAAAAEAGFLGETMTKEAWWERAAARRRWLAGFF